MLVLLIAVPILAALAIWLAPASLARTLAVLGSVGQLVLALATAALFDWSAGGDLAAQPGTIQWTQVLNPELGITLGLSADAVSMWLILLTAFLGPLMVFGSFSAITTRVKTYYAWLLALQGVIVGVFAATDLILFYICFEFTLVPMYVLISLYGSSNRRKAAVKFFLYTFTGSIVALAGLVYVAWQHALAAGEWSFALTDLQAAAQAMSLGEQALVLGALMLGFGVKVPIFPVHTWLPLAHTEAPTAGSVILAGVLLKLGTYAIYRFVLPFVPDAVVHYAPVLAVLALIGIVYAGLICWVQRDVKKLVAYSSVSHLGFCVLGLFALTGVGLSGSILYMINHGLSTGALFFCIGMMYERYHTRSLNELGGLATRMPIWAFFMVFFTMASVGLPGLNGFVSEIMCLLGTWQSGAPGVGGQYGPLGPWYAAVAGTGMIVAAIYLLFMVGKIVFGPLKEPDGHAHDDSSHGPALPPDLSAREVGVLVPLALACLILGIYPKPVLSTLEHPVAVTLGVYGHEGDDGHGHEHAAVGEGADVAPEPPALIERYVVTEVAGSVRATAPGGVEQVAQIGMALPPGTVIQTGFRSVLIMRNDQHEVRLPRMGRYRIAESATTATPAAELVEVDYGRVEVDGVEVRGIRVSLPLPEPTERPELRYRWSDPDGVPVATPTAGLSADTAEAKGDAKVVRSW
ncbi:MAG: NADH-quinone oxidoreductase subunit M [Planctomycetota bacterium]